jgi:hypothetical protein
VEKYVVSRELAEKLKEAEYPSNTVHYWHNQIVQSRFELLSRDKSVENIAAPMSDELLEQLPRYIDINGVGHQFRIEPNSQHDAKWWISYSHINSIEMWDESLVNGLADMWLYCKANGYIKEEEGEL